MTRTTYKGATFDNQTADMLRELDRRTPTIPVVIMQGSYSTGVAASAGTHAGGGAVDIAAANLSDAQRAQVVSLMREIGFAAWLRTPAEGFAWHIHGINVICPDLSPDAARQVVDYRTGRNGLALHGPDDGTRLWVKDNWATYTAAGKANVPKPPPPPGPIAPTPDLVTPVIPAKESAMRVVQYNGTQYLANTATLTYQRLTSPTVASVAARFQAGPTVVLKDGNEWTAFTSVFSLVTAPPA